jgi:acetyl esterase/lipase
VPVQDYPPELRALAGAEAGAYRIVHYGQDAEQFGELWLPGPAAGTGDGPARPVVALLHGGYWRARYRLDLMHALAADLAARGYVVWNIEYRRVGSAGGGWPGTFQDVAAAVDAVAGFASVDLSRVTLIGHSAGGHLALWAAGRARLGPDAPYGLGRPPAVTPKLVVSLAGVCDLTEAARRRLSDGAVFDLLGGSPQELPDVYDVACPARLLPLGVPQLAVHGTDDTAVPLEITTAYAAAAGPECTPLLLPGVDHFAVIDPASDAWAAVVEHVRRTSGSR